MIKTIFTRNVIPFGLPLGFSMHCSSIVVLYVIEWCGDVSKLDEILK